MNRYNLYGRNRRVYVRNGRIAAQPVWGAVDIELTQYDLAAGRINAHDHLELNHYPRTRFRDCYDNAHEWGEDIDRHLKDGLYANLRSYPIWDRCFIGGLKNLLNGVTTVAHHGALYRPLRRRDFPVRVLRRYGWAHSLHFDTPKQIQASYFNTPSDRSWFIHLAEGTDAVAASEYQQLKKLGCVGANTVIVHGVGLTDADMQDAAKRVRGLVICPSTNHYLLGETANVAAWLAHGGQLAIGTDSRLTADGTLDDEMKYGDYNPSTTTTTAARILGLSDVGRLQIGTQADLIAWSVEGQVRRGVALVMLGGIPLWGEPSIMAQFEGGVQATLDGMPILLHPRLARQYAQCQLMEPRLRLSK